MSALAQLHHSLTHVKTNSWHYRLVRRLWGGKAEGAHVYTYYWLMLPASGVYVAFYFTIYQILRCWVYVAGAPIGWFCGFRPRSPSYALQTGTYWYPYKTTPSGRKLDAAPWEIFTVAVMLIGVSGGLLWFLYHIIVDEWRLLLVTITFMVAGTAFIFLVYGIDWLVKRIGRWEPGIRVRRQIHNSWQVVCPTITVVDPE